MSRDRTIDLANYNLRLMRYIESMTVVTEKTTKWHSNNVACYFYHFGIYVEILYLKTSNIKSLLLDKSKIDKSSKLENRS